MRNAPALRFPLQLLLLAGLLTLFLLPGIRAMWGEQVTVRVLDAHGRPLPNAMVNATWELSPTKGNATTKNRPTAANGRVSFNLDNVDFDPDTTNYRYIVRVGYGNASAEEEFLAGNGSMPRTLQLPVYWITFFVRDREMRPIGLPLRVDDRYTLRSDVNGMAMLPLDVGNHTVSARFSDLDKHVTFEVKEDDGINVTLRLYNLAVRAIDDTGAPLAAEVYAGSASKPTNASGWANFYNLTDSHPPLTAYFGRYRKTALLNLDLDGRMVLIFDTHPPVIENVQSQWKGRYLQVRAVIRDLGEYSSGLREGNASIEIYYIPASGRQSRLPMYAVGYNLFEGLVPLTGGAQQVRYTIQATDAEGNSRSTSDIFVVPTPEDGGSNGTGEQPPVGAVRTNWLPDWGLPVLIALGLTVLAGGGYWYYRNKKPPSEELTSAPPGSALAYRAAPSGSAPKSAPGPAPSVPPLTPPQAPPAGPPQSPPAAPPAIPPA